MPPAIQAAFELEDEEFSTALLAALAELPEDEADAIVQKLRDADLIGGESSPDMERGRETVLASLPLAIRTAIERQDVAALSTTLQQLPPQEAEAIVQQLRDAGLIGISSGQDMERGREAMLAALPAAIRTAIERQDVEALGAALQQLRDAGLIGVSSGPEIEQVLRQFEPLLQGIAAVAKGDDRPRAEIEARLSDMEEKGWMLRRPVERIWSGERDAVALTAGLDAQDSALVRRILELLA
jgi:hypothetical protein